MLVKDWGGGGSREDVGKIDEAIVVAMSGNDGALNWGGGGWEGASYPVRLWEFLKDVKFKGMSLTLVMGDIGCRTPHNPPPTLTNIHLPLSSRPLLLISFPSLTQEWVSWETELSLSPRVILIPNQRTVQNEHMTPKQPIGSDSKFARDFLEKVRAPKGEKWEERASLLVSGVYHLKIK